jgi:hypothetical protein
MAYRHGQRGRVQGLVFEYCHKALSLGLLYYANSALASACAAARIKFPSPLIGASSWFPLAPFAACPLFQLVPAPEGACMLLGSQDRLWQDADELKRCCAGRAQACLASSRCC